MIEISESDVREALIEYTNKHSCMRLKPLENLKIGSIDVRNAFQYTLETFSEKRETKLKYHVYRGGTIDGLMNGPIPYKWDIKVNTPESFSRKIKIKLVMPHSEEVKTCHCCHGSGKRTCSSCSGSGGDYVSHYNSDSGLYDCTYKSCGSCGGSGRQTCSTCSGYGKLLWYLQLKIFWDTFRNDCFINEITTSIFPNKFIEKSEGEIVLKEHSKKVYPVTNFPDAAVITATEGLNDEHRFQHENECERILDQRHQIKVIPIAMTDWEYKKKNGKFYVYGNERRVYFPKYPGNNLRHCVLL